MTDQFKDFKKIPIQDLFGPHELKPFGVPIYAPLIANRIWMVMTTAVSPTVSPSELDLFSNYTKEELDRLRNDAKTYFLFSQLWEGHSYKNYNFYELITTSAQRHNIPAEKIFLLTSNLLEEAHYEHSDFKIHVIVFNYFAGQVMQYLKSAFTIDQTVENIKNGTHTFLSLNRRKKPLRNYTVYKLFENKIDALMSYNLLTHLDFDFDNATLRALCDSAPRTLDQENFEMNWACEPAEAANPIQLFKNTAASLVSETLFDTWDNTSIFYSEKTFKPMIYNHPVMIFGQQGLNTSLDMVGFKQYDKHFDLSFESITDPKARIDAQVAQLLTLNNLTVQQRIDWVLQDVDTIQHNQQALIDQTYNRKKLAKFISAIK